MMPEQRLPLTIDPLRYAKARRELAGTVAFAQMPRLAEMLSATEGLAQVQMSFLFDEEHRTVVKVCVQATLPLICQRCMQTVQYPVDVTAALCPVNDEAEAALLPEHYEPVVLTDEQCSPLNMVEEELLLSIPLVPVHHDKDCALGQNQAYYAAEPVVLDQDPLDRHHPFEVLAQLKGKK